MPDETENQKDKTSGDKPGQPSGGTKGTSKDKGKLYTDEAIAKIKSDAAAEAGRLRKAAETERDSLKKQLESTNSRLDALERTENESRLAEARGDPEQLRVYQRDQTLTKRERDADDRDRDLDRREQQLKSDQEELDKDRGVVSIAYTAAKHGLDPEELESLGISDMDTLDKVAEKIAAGKGTTAKTGEEGEEEGGEEEEWNPDTGEGTGGGEGALTTEKVDDMSMPSLEKAIEKASE